MNWASPQAAWLPGGRLHLQHGPIDLVIEAQGSADDLDRAHAAAARRFATVLGELTEEIALLRRPLAGRTPPAAQGSVARRMIAACWPHRAAFITPMAAVAGSVADEIKHVMLAAAPDLRSLYVNNGGDIAVHTASGEALRIGLVSDLKAALPEGVAVVNSGSGVGGIATSGWRGRSFSLGIADAATVLAPSAAAADAAATLIANAVDIEHPAVERKAARSLDPDSDLGDRLVTVSVGPLGAGACDQALRAGGGEARRLLADGLILGAAIALQGRWLLVDGGSGLLPAMA